jgi:DNA-directed RNA polymerase subunit beta'
LQEAVDALINNEKCVNPTTSSIKRPLKSLTKSLEGKQGRFRQNLLGKRVDYSGRSVIIVGPELKLNQCGLPYEMALNLFEPFILHRLLNNGLTYLSARKSIDNDEPIVWETLTKIWRITLFFLTERPRCTD